MAVGEWTDNRATFFFQKLALSADVDSLAENDHRLLVQGNTLAFPMGAGLRSVQDSPEGTTFYNMTGPMAGTGGLKFADTTSGGTNAQQYFVQEVTFYLFDRCPWNRLIFKVFVQSMADNLAAVGTARIRLYRRPDTTPRTPVSVYQLLAAGFTGPGWYGASIDITTTWTGDMQTVVYEQRGAGNLGGGAQVEAGSAFIQLGNSIVAGV